MKFLVDCSFGGVFSCALVMKAFKFLLKLLIKSCALLYLFNFCNISVYRTKDKVLI